MLASGAHFRFNHRFYRWRWAYDILRGKGDERESETKKRIVIDEKRAAFRSHLSEWTQ